MEVICLVYTPSIEYKTPQSAGKEHEAILGARFRFPRPIGWRKRLIMDDGAAGWNAVGSSEDEQEAVGDKLLSMKNDSTQPTWRVALFLPGSLLTDALQDVWSSNKNQAQIWHTARHAHTHTQHTKNGWRQTALGGGACKLEKRRLYPSCIHPFDSDVRSHFNCPSPCFYLPPSLYF